MIEGNGNQYFDGKSICYGLVLVSEKLITVYGILQCKTSKSYSYNNGWSNNLLFVSEMFEQKNSLLNFQSDIDDTFSCNNLLKKKLTKNQSAFKSADDAKKP